MARDQIMGQVTKGQIRSYIFTEIGGSFNSKKTSPNDANIFSFEIKFFNIIGIVNCKAIWMDFAWA